MKKIITTFFLIILSSSALAQISDAERQNIIQEQNVINQRDQQNQREIFVKEKDLQEVKKESAEAQLKEELDDLDSENGKVVQNLQSIQCFRIREIDFSPNKIIEKEAEENLKKNYIGKCLRLKQMAGMAQEITSYMVEKGYVTSRAEIPAQNLMKGILKINIVESYIEGIVFNEEKLSDKTQKFTAFGIFEENQILNLKPIEQGLDQVNRLQSNSAVMKILPGSNHRQSIVAIENHPAHRTLLDASYDNNGHKLTGDRRATFGFAHDNLFWLNDNLSIRRTSNDVEKTRKDHGGNDLLTASFSVPYQWYNLTLNYSKSSYFFWSGVTTRFKSSGETSTKSAVLDRLLLKNKKMKITANFSLTNRYNESFIDDVKISTSSRKATFATIGLSNTFFFHQASLFLKPTYSKSVNILDSQKNAPNLPYNAAHAEFDIYKLYANYTKKFQIGDKIFSYNGSFDSQIAEQRLYGIDKFSVGGIFSVRGFKNGTISGDSGYYLRNELSLNLGQIFSPLHRFSITPFYDYGYIRDKGGDQSGRISGAGLKIGYSQQHLNASLTFSQALSKSHLLAQNYRDNQAIFFSISTDFGI